MAFSPEAVLAVIARESGLDPAALTPEATFAELDMSSIDLASTVFAIEDELGIVIEPESLAPTTTIAELLARLRTLAAQ